VLRVAAGLVCRPALQRRIGPRTSPRVFPPARSRIESPCGVYRDLTPCASAARPDHYLARSAPATRGRVSSKRVLRSDTRSPFNAWGILFRYLRPPSRRRNRAALL
jgi:hypothetical protein